MSIRRAACVLLLVAIALPSAVGAREPIERVPPAPPVWKSDKYWTSDFAVPGLDGPVTVVEALGTDLYVGGEFTQADGVESRSLAMFDGRRWHAFPWVASPAPTTMFADGSSMLIAGGFYDPTSGRRFPIIRWNGKTVLPVGGDEMSGRIVRMFRWNGALVAAGGLEFADHPSSRYLLARFSGDRWLPLGPATGVYYAQASDAAVFQDRIVVGGKFIRHPLSGARGLLVLRPDEAAFDTLLADSTALSDRIEKLAVHDGRLIATGSIHLSPDPLGRYWRILASWDGATWTAMDDDFRGPIWVMRSTPEGLLMGGRFLTGPPNTPDPDVTVARWRADGLEKIAGLEGTQVQTLTEWSGRIVAGGERTLQFVETFDRSLTLGVFDGVDWQLPGVSAAHVAGFDRPHDFNGLAAATAFLAADGNWFVGGNVEFSWRVDRWLKVGPVARWDSEGWVPYGNVNYVGGRARALAWFRGHLYAAGNFALKTPTGFPAVTLMRSDGQQWVPVEGAPSGEVFTLAVFGDHLIVGGAFGSVGGQLTSAIAGYDGTQWSTVGNAGGHSQPSLLVRKLLVQDGMLYAAGQFESIAGVPARSIARWDGQEWTAVGDGYNGAIFEVAGYQNGIVVAGICNQSPPCASVTRWDGTAWEVIPDAPSDVTTMVAHGDILFVGGSFDGSTHLLGDDRTLRAWDGRSWHSLGSAFGQGRGGSGNPGQVTALALRNDVLWVGGSFTRAGGQTAMHVATWTGLTHPGRPQRSLRDGVTVTPNPSRPGAAIALEVDGGAAEVGIYDLAGRRLRTMTAASDGERASATWDGRDADGKSVPAGIYFARATREGRVIATRRLIRLP